MSNRRLSIALLSIAVAGCLVVGAWFNAMHRGDPNGPRYVLWKRGLLPFDPTVAYPAMVGDLQRHKLVVGLSVPELERRFGRLRTRADATDDYQKNYSQRSFLDREILWLGESPWLVVLEHGRVQELHLMKG